MTACPWKWLNGYGKSDLPNTEDTKDSLMYEKGRGLVNGSILSIVSGQRDHYHIENRMRRRDSSIIWVEEVGTISEWDADGNPVSMSSMAMDLSRVKQAEGKIRGMEQEARRVSLRAGQQTSRRKTGCCAPQTPHSGMNEHVAKPLEINAFLRVLEGYLGK